MRKSLMRRFARALVLILLLAQWAVASHACQMGNLGMASGDMSNASAMEQTPVDASARSTAMPMPDCDSMDAMTAYGQDKLCSDHCNYGDQSALSFDATVPAAVLSVLFVRPAPVDTASPRRASAAVLNALTLAAPPHAILHCVRRT